MTRYFCGLTLLCGVLVFATVSLAGTYSFTTTANQDEALQFVVEKENTRRAAQTPPLPAITIEQYLQQILTTSIPSYRAQFRQERVFDKLRDVWPTLTTTQQNNICSAIGVAPAACPR
jgi:hypothetical protein